MWQWLNKAFSAGKALEFAGSLLKDGAQQQMTGWLGLSLTDEAIMSQLMDCLTGDTRKAVEAFLIHIGDQKKIDSGKCWERFKFLAQKPPKNGW